MLAARSAPRKSADIRRGQDKSESAQERGGARIARLSLSLLGKYMHILIKIYVRVNVRIFKSMHVRRTKNMPAR